MKINSSLIKLFFKKGTEIPYCPRQAKEVFIDKRFPNPVSEAMLKGSYFETLALGCGARGEKTLDLPRKELSKSKKEENQIHYDKTGDIWHIGEKTVDQERIENQALVFKQVCNKYQIRVIEENTQVYIEKKFSDDITVCGELDIFPTPILTKDGLRLAIIDLKLTQNIANKFGDYCWGTPQYMDHIQPDMYLYLVEDIDVGMNPHLKEIVFPSINNIIKAGCLSFYYMLFDYKPNSEWKAIPHCSDKLRRKELFESIRKTNSLIWENDNKGWLPEPEYERCKICTVTSCEHHNHEI